MIILHDFLCYDNINIIHGIVSDLYQIVRGYVIKEI